MPLFLTKQKTAKSAVKKTTVSGIESDAKVVAKTAKLKFSDAFLHSIGAIKGESYILPFIGTENDFGKTTKGQTLALNNRLTIVVQTKEENDSLAGFKLGKDGTITSKPLITMLIEKFNIDEVEQSVYEKDEYGVCIKDAKGKYIRTSIKTYNTILLDQTEDGQISLDDVALNEECTEFFTNKYGYILTWSGEIDPPADRLIESRRSAKGSDTDLY